MIRELIKRSAVVFPHSDIVEAKAVRHARRQWVRSVLYLRNRVGGSRWVVDGAAGWKVSQGKLIGERSKP